MPRERTIYKAKYVGDAGKCRLIRNPNGKVYQLAKSITDYYSNDGAGNVKFSVEGWKEREIEAAGFSEA